MLLKGKQFIKSDLFKNSTIYFLITFISRIIPFFILPLMTQYLTPEKYGIAATYQMYISIGLLIVGFELNRYLDIYSFKVSRQEFSKYLSTIISSVVVSALFFTMIIGILLIFIDVPKIEYYWIFIIPIVVMLKFVFGINDNLLRNEEKPLEYGKYTLSETLIISFLSLLLAWLYHDWTSKAYGFIVSMVILGIFSYIRLKRDYEIEFFIDKEILKKAFIYSAPFVLGLNLANIIFANSDKMILLYFYDYKVVGIFAVALVFASIVGFVSDSFMKAWIPIFYRKLQNNDKNVDKQSFYIFIGLSIISVITIFILMFIMKYMIDEKYYDAIDVMPYIGIGYVFRILVQLLLAYMTFFELTKALYMEILIALISTIVIAYFLVNSYGMLGMAISYTIFYILQIVYYMNIVYNLRRIIDVNK